MADPDAGQWSNRPGRDHAGPAPADCYTLEHSGPLLRWGEQDTQDVDPRSFRPTGRNARARLPAHAGRYDRP